MRHRTANCSNIGQVDVLRAALGAAGAAVQARSGVGEVNAPQAMIFCQGASRCT